MTYTFESKTLLQYADTSHFGQPTQSPPVEIPEVTDLASYDSLIHLIKREGLDRRPGDFLEIGCLLGGGTAKLAKVAASVGKQVWVVDIFDPSFDVTKNLAGDRMSDLYREYLRAQTQEQVFRQVTAPWAGSIQVLKGDSMKVRFPDGLRFAFAFANGHHDPKWVRSDFAMVWKRLHPGGWAGFHDYGGDLPDVTEALDSMLAQHAAQIGRIEKIQDRFILLVEKKA